MADTVGFILQLVCNIYQTVQRAQRNKKELKSLEETIRQQVEPLLRQVQQARSTCPQVQQALDSLHNAWKSGKGAYRQLTDQLRSGAASARDSIKSGAANARDSAAKALR